MPDNLQRVDVVHVPDFIRESYEHTRLIGFRTTKRCDTSRFIQQIQPVYFSIDEKMCKENLYTIPQNLLEEIQEYGIECSDAKLQGVLAKAHALTVTATPTEGSVASQESTGQSDHLTLLVFGVIWCIFFITIALVIVQCKRTCEQKRDKQVRRNVQLVRMASSASDNSPATDQR